MPNQRLHIVAGVLFALLAHGSAGAAPPVSEANCVARELNELLTPTVLGDFAVAGQDSESSATMRDAVENPRRLLVDFALQLRDIKYRRGGRAPATGFDCSGFVHYVFSRVLAVDLPSDSASQYDSGAKIGKAELQAGDLVFFRTRGKRISHVGLYLGDGRFIHAPASGERVRVDQLDGHYWTRRFAGARRPDVLT